METTWLEKRTALTPDRLALRFENQQWSFRELEHSAQTISRKLASVSWRGDAPVALLIGNTPRAVILLHAFQLLGIPVLLLNRRLSHQEHVFQLDDSGAQRIVSDRVFSEKYGIPSHEWEEIQTWEETTYSRSQTAVCSYMYTSGTTGRPKAVVHTYDNHFASATGAALNSGLHLDDIWLCAVPLFHISGFSIVMRSVIYGNGIELHERFDEQVIDASLKSGGVTMISVVSTMLLRLLAVKGTEPYHSSVRCMLLGGGPAPESVVRRCHSEGIPVFQTYGMTETASQCVTLSPEDSLRKVGSSGKALFLTGLKIVDENRAPVPDGEAGEIAVKGPNVTAGYHNRPEVNKRDFVDGWFYTGDIGVLDPEGFLTVLDRRSDLIISGGENIYPAEVEAVLQSCPDIEDVGVIGEPDERWGEVPVAFIKSNGVSRAALEAFCEGKLASYKKPRRYYAIDDIPRNASSKLQRFQLRKEVVRNEIH